jgi:ceramide glucosyltransferase
LHNALQARAWLDYPATIQHVLICDTTDEVSQAIVASFLADFPALQAQVVLVQPEKGRAVVSKIEKLQAALPQATGHVFCFVDDDVSLRPHSLKVLVPYLFEPEAGVAFGLPCFTNWQTIWSSLISGLINAHMVLSFVALTYLTNPFRINGHIFAFRREIFQQMGGFDGLEQHIDDEYEIAKRVRTHSLRAMQTPLIYDIDNALPTRQAYTRQFKRWFVMPRQAMMPSLTTLECMIAGLSSLTLPIPSILALLTLLTRRRSTVVALSTTLTLFGTAYALCEKGYLQRRTPLRGWLLLPVVAIWLPLHILWTLLLNNEVDWRGQRLRLLRNGTVEVVS